ncbi:MAG: cytochrome c biogenesis CcdA family protein [Hyphomicrobiaceae bacterium]
MDLEVGVGAALLAGLLSFVSPCVLPLVPPYMAYIAGVSFSELQTSAKVDSAVRWRIVLAAVAFVAGFTVVFVALGATASVIGQSLARHYQTLSIVAGGVIVLMGLHFLGLLRFDMLYKTARIEVQNKPAGLVGAFVMGLAFAFGWTPCVGPVLAAILFMASSSDSMLASSGLLFAYSMGIGIPFVLAAVFASQFIDWAARFRRHMPTVEKAMGVLLIGTGILFMTGQMSVIAQWLLEMFPGFADIG